MQQMDWTTHNIVNDNLEALKQLFPEAFSEDKVDFEKLQLLLWTNISNDKEKYSFSWKGKNDAIKLALAQNTWTLRPDKESSKNWDITQNLYIEWDNLEVLRCLQDSYRWQVKMIYIDPPYNTWKDFVYKDNFVDNVSSYKEKMWENMKSNPETNGRYHTDWLNMMYPRLKLARNLLSWEWVIFISIWVEELTNLKKLCDEIFGEDNFVEIFSWVKTSTPPALSTKSRKTNEYIICYEKNKNSVKYNGEMLDGGDQPLLNSWNSIWELKFPKDKVYFKENKFPNGILKQCKPDRVELIQDIEIINWYATQDFILRWEFKWTQKFLDEEIKKGTTFVIKSEILSIRFIRDEDGFKRPTNFIKDVETPLINKKENNVGTNENASSLLKELMNANIFDNPKPISLIQYLANFIVKEDDLILDFFSGSATTAHAVMQLNAEDWGNRKFIMVQIPEETATDSEAYKAWYKNICEIWKERIRRSGEKILQENKDKEWIENLDVWFKVFKLDTTNLKKWETSVEWESEDEIKKELQMRLQDMKNPVKEDRNQIDMVYEIMLKNGMDLTLPMQELSIKWKKVFSIADNYLIACLEKNIDLETVKEIATLNPKVAVFYDDSFADDRVKINAIQNLEKNEIQIRVI